MSPADDGVPDSGDAHWRHDVRGTAADAWRSHEGWAALQPIGTSDPEALSVHHVIVVAAHPDDETLGAGGLMATLASSPAPPEMTVVLLTAGEASHPASPTLSPAELAWRRRAECRAALAELGEGIELVSWDAPDGRLAEREDECAAYLTDLVVERYADCDECAGSDGPFPVLIVAPWRHDGHPDHEAAGRAAAAAAVRTGARWMEYPIWLWHWAQPDQAPWEDLRLLPLDEGARAAKDAAMARHESQVRPLSDQPGDEVLLGPDLLRHFEGDEVFVVQAPRDGTLDRLHARMAEPWGVDTRWFEQRKRDLLLSLLPRRTFGRGLELGCSTGALALALAGRCERLVAVDSSLHALRAARQRLGGLQHVSVQQRVLPHDLPEGPFDLVVLSETGYFLGLPDLAELVDRVADLLSTGGVIVLCHWRHPVEGWTLDGGAVHAIAEARLARRDLVGQPGGWGRLAEYRDRDVEMLLLGPTTALPESTR